MPPIILQPINTWDNKNNTLKAKMLARLFQNNFKKYQNPKLIININQQQLEMILKGPNPNSKTIGFIIITLLCRKFKKTVNYHKKKVIIAF